MTGSNILTEPKPDQIGIILAGTGPDYKPEKVNRIQPDFLNFHTQLTSHKHKYGSLDFEIWVEGEGQDTSRHLRSVLGPCAQCCPCNASEQKMGPKTKI